MNESGKYLPNYFFSHGEFEKPESRRNTLKQTIYGK